MSNFRVQVKVPGGEFSVTRKGVDYDAHREDPCWHLPLDRAEEVFRGLHASVETLLALEPIPLPESLLEEVTE